MSEITAPMGGKVIEVKVNVGDAVNENDEVVILDEFTGRTMRVRSKRSNATRVTLSRRMPF